MAKMEKLALSVPGVLGVHDLRAEYVGPDIVHAGMHIKVANGTPIEEADRISHEVEEKIHAGKSTGYCFIHMDPVEPTAERVSRPELQEMTQ
jgi:divalent metal cation (Fe/Co/Zn/Cd) transporter